MIHAPSAHAQGSCLTADPPPITAEPKPIRFGITPQIAGSAGLAQGEAAPENPEKALEALRALRPERRQLVMRLNRLFFSEGDAAIERFGALVDRYAEAGLESEIQIRYHPSEKQEGDLEAWERFVRAAVRRLAAKPAVVALTVTNEANLPISPNTSDGSYDGVKEALVRGVVAAREEVTALGRFGLPIGFTVVWRWFPSSDAAFWRDIGRLGGERFREALSFVGVQLYPGLFWPPVPLAGRTPGQEVIEALTLIRNCFMPMASLDERTALWVTENGYATNLGRTESSQRADLTSTIEELHRYSGTLGADEYRWFNLRDNDSDGLDLFSAVGLLRDDYSRKPAFATYRELIERYGREVVTAERERSCLPRRASARGDRLGLARLERRRSVQRRVLGEPVKRMRFGDRWCVVGGGSLRAAYDDRGRTALLVSTAPGYRAASRSRLGFRAGSGRSAVSGIARRSIVRSRVRLNRYLRRAGLRAPR